MRQRDGIALSLGMKITGTEKGSNMTPREIADRAYEIMYALRKKRFQDEKEKKQQAEMNMPTSGKKKQVGKPKPKKSTLEPLGDFDDTFNMDDLEDDDKDDHPDKEK